MYYSSFIHFCIGFICYRVSIVLVHLMNFIEISIIRYRGEPVRTLVYNIRYIFIAGFYTEKIQIFEKKPESHEHTSLEEYIFLLL